jgi:hypothetical protein
LGGPKHEKFHFFEILIEILAIKIFPKFQKFEKKILVPRAPTVKSRDFPKLGVYTLKILIIVALQ